MPDMCLKGAGGGTHALLRGQHDTSAGLRAVACEAAGGWAGLRVFDASIEEVFDLAEIDRRRCF